MFSKAHRETARDEGDSVRWERSVPAIEFHLLRCMQSADDKILSLVKPAVHILKLGIDVSSSFLTFPIRGLAVHIREERDPPIINHSAE